MSASSGSGTTNAGATPSEDLSYRGGSRRRGKMMTAAGVGVVIVVAIIAAVAGWAIGAYVTPSTSGGARTVILTESGSSLLYPAVNNEWGPGYTAQFPNIQIAAHSTGSGTGQSLAEGGSVDIGASDAYLSNASQTNLVNFPMAVSSQLVYYNLPGITAHLNLNATVIAKIYLGQITSWNDPMIQAANPGVSLPAQPIVPVARQDGSGDTFLITSYMFMGCSCWHDAGQTYSTAKLSGTLSSQITFATGNGGMVTAAAGAPYTIAYIGISYESEAASKGLQYAYLGDNLANSASGGQDAVNYIAPTAQYISYDANLGLTKLDPAHYGLAVCLIMGAPAGGAIDLVPGAGGTSPNAANPTPYPDVNLEYGLVKTNGGGPGGASHAYYVVQFLTWVVSVGNLPQFLNPVHFLPLTPAVVNLDYGVLLNITTATP